MSTSRNLYQELEIRRIQSKKPLESREATDIKFVSDLLDWLLTDSDWLERSLTPEYELKLKGFLYGRN